MKRALISVSNKENLIAFVTQLISFNYEIISTGGTKKFLEENKIPVIGIEEITHFPEMLDGRVKTLHPNIHAGLLFKRDNKVHINTIQEHNIKAIDLVVVNLYPFKETISKKNIVLDEAIEQIDIGGPSMLRSAAKNFKDVTVIVDTQDYDIVIQELKNSATISHLTNQKLAVKVFQHTAGYDTLIANYLNEHTKDQPIFAEKFTSTFEKIMDLRYGENPHQKAAYYKNALDNNLGLTNATQLQGKELSYNNILDANAAIEIISEFKNEFAVVAVKHNNPCGVGVAASLYEAWQKAFNADKISIFGGIIVLNHEVDEKIAQELKEIFLEVIIAPSFTNDALQILKTKKNLRLLKLNFDYSNDNKFKTITIQGGLLIQEKDNGIIEIENLKCVTDIDISTNLKNDLLFAWKVVKHVKSNAIVVAANLQTCGVGAGQMNRIASAYIALEQAKQHKITNLVLASDAFFPFSDVVEIAAQNHIKAIIQPGGSIQDKASIESCNKYGIAMYFTEMRHFKH